MPGVAGHGSESSGCVPVAARVPLRELMDNRLLEALLERSRAGTAWTGQGTARQKRGLKHRAVQSPGRTQSCSSIAATARWLNSGVPASESPAAPGTASRSC
jgi:hypothetical protein